VIRRSVVAVAIVLGLLGGWTSSASADVPHGNHVFIVVLENENEGSTFGTDTKIPYLANTLTAAGAFVPNYYATGHASLDNYVAMISGQGPNIQTQSDCQFFSNFTALSGPDSNGQYVNPMGGCVYPAGAQNIATQLEGNGYSWRAYMQDMANSAPAQPATCRHPAINSQDGTQTAKPNDQYASRHNPFVYFHSIIDLPTCQANVVDLSRLGADLGSKETTPDYSFITPDLCNDGHDTPCIDGGPGGMVQANSFLKNLVPEITSSPGFQDRGLLIVLFDEAGSDSSACCGEQPGPNTPSPGGSTPGPGGGKVGAVLVSNCIQPGTVSKDPYNHYSLLRSIEDNFGLPHLGFAGQTGLKPFDAALLNEPSCPKGAVALCKTRKRHKKHRRTAEVSKHKKHKHKKCKKRKKPHKQKPK
jgi:phosphatidylinositol-3-phosphatase